MKNIMNFQDESISKLMSMPLGLPWQYCSKTVPQSDLFEHQNWSWIRV